MAPLINGQMVAHMAALKVDRSAAQIAVQMAAQKSTLMNGPES
jgi:hypothetical protein